MAEKKNQQSYHPMFLKHFRRQVSLAGPRGGMQGLAGTARAGTLGSNAMPRLGAVPQLSAACYFSWDEENALA